MGSAPRGGALALVALSFLLNGSLRLGYERSPAFSEWIREHPQTAEASMMLLRGGLWILIAFLFSGYRSPRAFVREAGFARRLTFSGWIMAWLAIAFGLFDIYVVQKGWGRENPSAPMYPDGDRIPVTFFAAYTVALGPLIEELVMRGFLYRAFRGSFGLVTSSVLVLCFQTYFHWGLLSQNLPAFVLLTVGGVILCVIRERTGNGWNCVLFHAAHKATAIRQWSVAGVAMMILFLLADRRKSEGMNDRACPH